MRDQHFMIDKELLQRIILAAEIKNTDIILEIGPGTGNLTELLLEKAKYVHAIEKDKELINKLKEKYKKKINFILDDATKAKFPEFNKCISNLPYTICEPLLWKFTRYTFNSLIFVVPQRFTDLLLGNIPSRLKILTDAFYEIEYKELILSKSFDPKPRGDSALIKITLKQGNSFLKEFLSQYDKKTKNAVKEILMKKGKTKSEALENIALKLRPSIQNKNIISLSLKEIKEVIKHFEAEKKTL